MSCLAREIWYCGGIIPCTLTLRGKDKISLSSHHRRDGAGGGEENGLVNVFRIGLDICSVFLYDAPTLLVDRPLPDFANTYICSDMRIAFLQSKTRQGWKKGLCFLARRYNIYII